MVGSGICKKPIQDSGSRGPKGTGSQIPDPRSGSASLQNTRVLGSTPAHAELMVTN